MNSASNDAPPSSSSTTKAVAEEEEEKEVLLTCTEFSALHPDIIESHILTRLDGPSLATSSCSSASLRRISSRRHLWSQVCHSTWPSTASTLVSGLISIFPDGGPRAFFAESFPLPDLRGPTPYPPSSSAPPSEFISAVDIHYKNKLIFSKVQQTETVTGWFRCSPFRIDLLEPKDVVPTGIRLQDDTCCSILSEGMELSWILIDPVGRRAVNLSSQKPVSVQRHWLSGEVQVRFATILPAAAARGQVQCKITLTCGKSMAAEGGEMMQVREVSMEMEDMDGMHLNGRDSLVSLERALEGKRGNSRNREEEARRQYKEYGEMKKERKERKLRTERALDVFSVAFGVSILVAFWGFLRFT